MSKATCIMVQGTMSGAGKSLLCAALCRIFAQDGWRVAPFKSQNMALNSFVTRDGLEMGRAQVVQAQAAGVEPDVRMNPILLKPSSDIGSQVIVNGEVRGQMPAAEYFHRKKQLIPDILAAYNSLAEDFDIIVIEGAGSPAEINLKADDIVNMGLAKLVDAPVLLVGDIDRGGVFAQLFGTVELLEPDERARIKGLIINKFRGDVGILRPGLAMLEEKTHLGVLTGSPITDMRITLCAGKAHVKHTEGGDFRQATYRAVRNGLRKAESVLLEPWYDFLLELPTGNVGRAMTDLQQMGAKFQPPETEGDRSVLQGSAPVAKLRGYAAEVTGYTHGMGRLVCSPKGYAPCQNPEEVIASVGYDCDGDLENTADSIFCAHGAGYAVKWDEVEQHMHLPSCLTAQPEEVDVPETPVRSAGAAYHGSLAEDKELMAIFERTYGKIERSPRQALYTPKEEPAQYHGKPDPAYDGEEYLLVDGYNIIFAWDELKTIARDNLDGARGQLMHILSNYCGYRQCRLILVFDAYKVKGQHGETEQYHNITVVYTKEAETADSYIEKATLDLSKKHKVRVATSDGMEQLIILGNGALRVSAEEFRQEVLQTETAIRAYASQLKQGKKTITEKQTPKK